MVESKCKGRLVVLTIMGLAFFHTKLNAQISNFENINFKKADSVAALYHNHSLTDLRSLSNKLTDGLETDVEKFRSIFKWVCDNIENDYDFYISNKRKREKLKDSPEELDTWNSKFTPRVFKKLLNEHKTVCTGYAYLIKELTYHAGLASEIINGYGRTAQANTDTPGIPNHSWNAIQINGEWYLCDATWASGSINPQQASFLRQFNEAYFLTDPSVFALNHYPLDTSWLLMNEKPTLETFLNAPLIYKGAINHNVLPVLPGTFNIVTRKGEKTDFSFKGAQASEQVELQITRGSSVVIAYPEITLTSDGLSSISYIFSRTGTYVVHMLKGGDYIFTYTVKVSK